MGAVRIKLSEQQLYRLRQLSQERRKPLCELVAIALEQFFSLERKDDVSTVR